MTQQRQTPAYLSVALTASIIACLVGCNVKYEHPAEAGTPANRVEWLDTSLYPFESRFKELPSGILHYIDEGATTNRPIVFVHGTPTWSFLYRDVIKGLLPDYRLIAADHIGFGLSSKPTPDTFGYSPQEHSENLIRLLDHLDLQNVTLVIHDLGGPIGIAAALARPERVDRIVVINSFAWSLSDNEDVQTIDGLLQSSLGEWLYLNRNISPEILLPGAFSDNYELREVVKRHYTHPFPDKTTRHGLLEIGRALAGESEWYDSLWAEQQALAPKIQLLVFGLEDEFFGRDAFERWKNRFPNAEAIGLEGVGHFPQEEATDRLIQALRQLMQAE